MISFLVPTLGNREYELKRLLDSLVLQESKMFEVIIVAQGNYTLIEKIIYSYKEIKIKLVCSNELGLSKNRNIGLVNCSGDIVVLSDDDCWYPSYSVGYIIDSFRNKEIDIILTKIKDPITNRMYKQYDKHDYVLKNRFKLLSKSSIEIACRRDVFNSIKFDEDFGLGARFVCCEEIDFLLNAFKSGYTLKYVSKMTVYHKMKNTKIDKEKIIAKGALYAKHFNLFISLLVCMRDLVLKGQFNISYFWKGYNSYKNISIKNKKIKV